MDANVLIRGITFPRYPYEILRLATRHEIVMVISPTVLADARHYLSTLFPNHLPKLDDPTLDEVRNHRDLVRDIKDVPVVLAAVKASVDYLVSTDADLTDVDASTEALRLLLEPAKVLRVGTFLHDVMGWSHQALDSISRRRWDEIHGDTWTR